MKKLIFVRHGKAEDPSSEFNDFERSLTSKGKLISKQMADRLAQMEESPGLIITSPAFRALETAMIFSEVFRIKPERIILDSNLYYKMSLQYLLQLLSETDNNIETVSLFGHNPSFSEIPDILCSNGSDFMAKSGIAGISFSIKNWSGLKPKTGKMEYFLKPDKTI